MKAQLLQRIRDKSAVVGVVGLGYVGLPLAVAFGQAGLRVLGVDVDAGKVARLSRGESYVPDVSTAQVAELVQRGSLAAATDYAALHAADAVILCVPTPLRKTRDPDLSYIVNASESLMPHVRHGQLLVLESTTYPGTTEEVLEPQLKARGFRIGEDVFLAFSPERIDPGNRTFTVRNTPKVVGGATAACTEVAAALYGLAVERVVKVSSPRAAEMVKLLENTFRAVNIGLVNEVALMCARLGVDVWEVIDAAATKPYGFMKFTPGPGIGGHCLSGHEFVFIKDEHGCRAIRLKDLVNELEVQPTQRLSTNGTLILAPQGLSVLSFDADSRRTCFKPLQYVSRRAFAGQMLEVLTQDGRRLTVTDGHPMLIWRDGGLVTRRAEALQPGDELPVPLGTSEAPTGEIDLIAHLSESDIARMRAKAEFACFADYDAVLRPELRKRGVSVRDVYRQNVMPLSVYLALEQAGVMPISRRQIRLATGRGPSYNSFPAIIPLDEDFARLVGYYLSEGCLTEDSALRVRFTLSVDESETIADLTGILNRLGVSYSQFRDRQWRSYHIKVSSRPLAILLRDVLKCGVNCYNMQIPGRLLIAPEPIRRALLAGLLRGDGDVHHTHETRSYAKRNRQYQHVINTCAVGYFSSSPVLFQQAIHLLHSLNLVPTFRRNKPHLRLYGETQLAQLQTLFLDNKRIRLENYACERSKRMPVKQHIRHDGLATVKVRLITEAAQADAVYSLEVADTHTFVTSYGLLVHNCIPVDPLYLSWKLKALNYTARFIELADTINGQMPHHVVTLAAEALNEAGKPLYHANVLVLGAAYKPDVDDVRESPALDVMIELQRRHAHVSYHDPHVPALNLGAETLTSTPLTADSLRAADCVMIITAHTTIDWALVAAHARLVIDTRNALKGRETAGRVVRL
jgi:nucleotide sugar dehydrogenase